MLKLYILVGVVTACYGETILINPRIENGLPVEIGKFPFAASVQIPLSKGPMHLSTGTILTNRWILTTASRLKYFEFKPGSIVVRTGSTHIDNNTVGDLYNVEEKIIHPSYDPNLFDFDMALLKVERDIEFNDNTTSIDLYTADSVDANLSGSLVGWGNSYVDNLKVSRLYSIELKTIGTIAGMKLHVSAVNENACYSDVGGPFVVNGKVLGISTVNRMGCGLTDQYVNRFDASTLEWINSVIA